MLLNILNNNNQVGMHWIDGAQTGQPLPRIVQNSLTRIINSVRKYKNIHSHCNLDYNHFKNLIIIKKD